MGSTLLDDDAEAVVRGVIAETRGRPIVVNPNRSTLETIVEGLAERATGPEVTVLADDDVLDAISADFLVASRAADLVESGGLALRSLDSPPNHSIVLGEDELTALVDAGGRMAALSAGDEKILTAAREHYEALAAEASEYALQTPPLTRVRDTLASDIGPETAGDFDAVLESIASARTNGDGIDEVTVSLLVAARNNELLYDISKWGEDVGLASKATFSRTKTTMEDKGLIATEKVPIDVGRPRLRLMFGDDRLKDSSAEELPEVARRLLAA